MSVSALMTILGLVIGVLLFIGLVSYHAVFLIPFPTSGFPPSTNPEIINYQNTVRALGWTSVLAMDLAVSLTVMFAWIVGTMRGDVTEGLRRGVFLFAAVFLAVWLLVSIFAYTIFRAFFFPFS